MIDVDGGNYRDISTRIVNRSTFIGRRGDTRFIEHPICRHTMALRTNLFAESISYW